MPSITDKNPRLSDIELTEFVMSFVAESDKMRSEFVEIFHESINNYLVNPFSEGVNHDKSTPYYAPGVTGNRSERIGEGYSVLKDSESHQIVETLLGSAVLAVLSERGFIRARRTGFEDTFKASTVTKLLEYHLSRDHVFRTIYLWLKSGFIFGTGIVRTLWEYDERPTTIRQFDLEGGVELAREFPGVEILHDDPEIVNVNILDFYPDPGNARLHKMMGAAEKFCVHGRAALAKAERGEWRKQAVRRALNSASEKSFRKDTAMSIDEAAFEGVDRPENNETHEDFQPMTGYTYWGEVPWKPADGIDWRKITVLNGELVQDIAWPFLSRRLPFHDFTVCPMDKRFYGVAPLEVSRHSQDLVDQLTMLIADAATRMTHPQPLVHRDAMIRADQFMKPRPNQPIFTDRMDGVDYLKYDVDLGQSAGVAAQQKQSMRERTGATDVEQGLGFGTKRLSASEASIQAQRSGGRSEMTNMLIERDAMPPLGKSLLRLDQQFFDDSDDIRRRIGETPNPYPIADIMADYDLQFVGSRSEHNQRSKLEAMERIAPLIGALPTAPLFPWAEYMIQLLSAADLHELEAAVADPVNSATYLKMAMLMNGGAPAANGNGVAEGAAPSGLLPAQVSGGPVV